MTASLKKSGLLFSLTNLITTSSSCDEEEEVTGLGAEAKIKYKKVVRLDNLIKLLRGDCGSETESEVVNGNVVEEERNKAGDK